MKKGLITVSILIVLLTGCATVEETGFPSHLMGIIFDNYNNPVTGASIILEDGDILTSDIDGRFIIPDLTPQTYKLQLSKPNYETVYVEINFLDPKQVLYVKMSSITYLKEQIEACIKSKDWEKADKLIERAFLIDEDDPVLIYLASIYCLNIGDYTKALDYVADLKGTGYSTDAVFKLEKEIEKMLSSE